ncbi:transglutaminase domain-containing protein [Paenibacillus sp. MMS20-IR301]|uniref:transglutaminase domain-containing protein n=1 Tax=Paenibacillus sp. MMS20-IR301 TaxID=2895946 RepID=UPI0028E84AFD|nr:transglutaminase domain-containing protein [Paenibacillus sp. MMS20-IR301]WNS44179.1 transglutaminase domain-containing protein [Paenibacillus sp. MMS20-IR301]
MQQARADLAAPDFGPNVLVFDPAMPGRDIQEMCDRVFAEQERAEFGRNRCALLFKPGVYDARIRIGFYTQAAGLGESPDQVRITGGGINCDADWMNGLALINFWRSAEGIATEPVPGEAAKWTVSQAAPYRRMHVLGDLELFDHAEKNYASGGFMADTAVDGSVNSGPQQQFYLRNSQWSEWHSSQWNNVFQGCVNPPESAGWPSPPNTVLSRVPVVREKPYLYIASDGRYYVKVPQLRAAAAGITWSGGATEGKSLELGHFYIAKAGQDTAKTLNRELAAGRHLLLTPGIYGLEEPVRVEHANTVVLGLGLATLVPEHGATAMQIADVDGVIIAGLLFDAGTEGSGSLLEVGPPGCTGRHSANPASLHDLFFRVGGAGGGRAEVCLTINSSDVIGDHFWLWRADHGEGVGWERNTSDNGIIINGDHVTIYGLFVEHFQKYQTVWNGDYGRLFFYQSEIPYDVPDQASWMNGGVNGFASYKVSDTVTRHEAHGLGIYSFFNAGPHIRLHSAIEAPASPEVRFTHMVDVFLNGNGEITRMVNGLGATACEGSRVHYLAEA